MASVVERAGCCELLSAIHGNGLGGWSYRNRNQGGIDCQTVCVVRLPDVAEIFTLPGATLVASPELLTVTTAESEELQVTEAVKSALLPFE